jgi:hypothetical protein
MMGCIGYLQQDLPGRQPQEEEQGRAGNTGALYPLPPLCFSVTLSHTVSTLTVSDLEMNKKMSAVRSQQQDAGYL